MNPIGILTLLQPASGIVSGRAAPQEAAQSRTPGRAALEADTYEPAASKTELPRVTYGRGGT